MAPAPSREDPGTAPQADPPADEVTERAPDPGAPSASRERRWRVPAGALATVRRGRSRWRRSLLVRVVAATVTLGLLVVLVTGQFLLQRISNGLVDSRVTSVEGDAKQGIDEVDDNFQKNNFNLVEFPTFVQDQVNMLQGPVDNPIRYVVLRHAKTETDP